MRLPTWCIAVQLDQLRIVHVTAKRALNGFQIDLVAIGSQLDAIGETGAQNVHELDCVFAVAATDHVGHDQLAVAVQCGPCPCVASELRGICRRLDVLLFGICERPNFIALDHGRSEVANVLVVIPCASFASVDQQLVDGIFGHVRDPRGCTNAVTLNKKADNQDAGFSVQFSHTLYVVTKSN